MNVLTCLEIVPGPEILHRNAILPRNAIEKVSRLDDVHNLFRLLNVLFLRRSDDELVPRMNVLTLLQVVPGSQILHGNPMFPSNVTQNIPGLDDVHHLLRFAWL